jgi:hypothetical protein
MTNHNVTGFRGNPDAILGIDAENLAHLIAEDAVPPRSNPMLRGGEVAGARDVLIDLMRPIGESTTVRTDGKRDAVVAFLIHAANAHGLTVQGEIR